MCTKNYYFVLFVNFVNIVDLLYTKPYPHFTKAISFTQKLKYTMSTKLHVLKKSFKWKTVQKVSDDSKYYPYEIAKPKPGQKKKALQN